MNSMANDFSERDIRGQESEVFGQMLLGELKLGHKNEGK
jgi:hypothetical protein